MEHTDKANKSERRFPWGSMRRFNSFTDHMKKNHGVRIQKVSIDAGFTCPNRDGSKGRGGCTYCSNDAFNPSYCQSGKPISLQIDEGVAFHKGRYRRVDSFLAYFQAYSNTYASLDTLEKLFGEALQHPDIDGLIIGTRPDCVNSEILDYLTDLSKRYLVSIEYGIESCYNKTLKRINRGHTFEDAIAALQATKLNGINACAHFIFGLPGETRLEMMNEAEIISKLPLTSIKFHQLQIIKGTVMEHEYRNNPSDFELFTLEEYLDFIIGFLERFNPEIVVERFTGEAPPRYLVTKSWGNLRTDQLVMLIEKRLEELDTWQGRLYKSNVT